MSTFGFENNFFKRWKEFLSLQDQNHVFFKSIFYNLSEMKIKEINECTDNFEKKLNIWFIKIQLYISIIMSYTV